MQSDPIGLEGGLNTYVYAKQNPLSYIDPYGLRYSAGSARPSGTHGYRRDLHESLENMNDPATGACSPLWHCTPKYYCKRKVCFGYPDPPKNFCEQPAGPVEGPVAKPVETENCRCVEWGVR